MSSKSDREVGRIFQVPHDGICLSAVSRVKLSIRRIVKTRESPHALITDVPRELKIAISKLHRHIRQFFDLDLEGTSPLVRNEVIVVRTLCSQISSLESESDLTTWKALLEQVQAAESAIARRPLSTAHSGEA